MIIGRYEIDEPVENGEGIHDGGGQDGGSFVFTPDDGLYTTFPGYAATINDMGQILVTDVGLFDGDAVWYAVLREPDGTTTPITPPGAIRFRTSPEDINNDGDIVGHFNDDINEAPDAPPNPDSGFMRSGQQLTDVEQFTVFLLPDAVANVRTHSINCTGQVAGWFDDMNGVQRGFPRSPTGEITVFDPPNSLGLEARGLNEAGQVTGGFLDAVTGTVRGYVRSADGQFTVFDAPNSTWTEPRAINNVGQITGWFDDSGTESTRGFLYTPEPVLPTNTEAIGVTVDRLEATGSIGSGQADGLRLRLSRALHTQANGHSQAAANALMAFVLQVRALVDAEILTCAEGQALMAR